MYFVYGNFINIYGNIYVCYFFRDEIDDKVE